MADNPSGTAGRNKQIVLDLIETMWRRRELHRLADFWTHECINHAAPTGAGKGLAALTLYHQQFGPLLAGLSDVTITVLQQIAEDDRVVTHVRLSAHHTGAFMGVAATARTVSLATIKIDRLVAARIAEHRSVADMLGCWSRSRLFFPFGQSRRPH